MKPVQQAIGCDAGGPLSTNAPLSIPIRPANRQSTFRTRLDVYDCAAGGIAKFLETALTAL